MAEDWLIVLREECKRSSQAKVAKRLGVSAPTVSQVLNGTYAAGLDRFEARVRGALMGEMVSCPVLGEIPRQQCCDEQNKPFAATNPVRVSLYRACRAGCQYSFLSRE